MQRSTHRRSRQAVAAGLALPALLAGLLTPPATAAPDDAAPPADPQCATEAADQNAASAIAVECARDVEIASERTPWETTYASPDGSNLLEVSTTAIRTDISGEWTDIDTDLSPTTEGIVVNAPVFAMTFSDGTSDQPLASIVRDGETLTYDTPFDLTTPVVDGSQITYPEVLPEIDLVVTVNEDGTGFSQVLRIPDAAAADTPALAELTFPLEVSAGLEVAEDQGGFQALDAEGNAVFASPTPTMWDSSGQISDVEVSPLSEEEQRLIGPVEGDVVAEMPLTAVQDAVVITPDAELLTSPDTTWPVYIDPYVSGNRHEWTVIYSGRPNDASKYQFPGDQGVGRCDAANCTHDTAVRMIFEFNQLGTLGALEGYQVKEATFTVLGTHSWSCTKTGVELWATGDMHSGTTWANHASTWFQHLQTQTITHREQCTVADQRPRDIDWNVWEAARIVAHNNGNQLTLGLKASNESVMSAGWKRYRNDAKLSIRFEREPVPHGAGDFYTNDPYSACVTGENRPYLRSTTPEMKWRVTDPDGGDVYGNLDVLDIANLNHIIWDAPETQRRQSGGEFSLRVPPGILQNGRSYQWRGGGLDVWGAGYGPMRACEFTIDTTAPNTPGVVPVTTGNLVPYNEDKIAGGIGQAGQFQLTNGGSGDVVSYKYSINSDGLTSTVTQAAGAKVSFTPTRAGSHTLYVQSIDRAGWASAPKKYRFSVKAATKEGFWRFTEGSGVVADSSYVLEEEAPEAPKTGPMTLSSNSLWSTGPRVTLADDPTGIIDHALKFSTVNDTASTNEPVIDTSKSFTVMAQLYMTAKTNYATAVSQDGNITSGFKFGVRTDSCGTADGRCWGFWMSDADDYGASVTKVMAKDTPVVLNRWVHLTGIYNSDTRTMSLYFCDLGAGPGDQLGDQDTKAAFTQTNVAERTWSAGGPLRLGRAVADGLPDHAWPGLVDDVQVYSGAVSIDAARRGCQPPD